MRAIIGIDNWMRCGRCGHKLGKAYDMTGIDKIVFEIKCHSCKELNTICKDSVVNAQDSILGVLEAK